jgi:cytochrome b
MNTTYVSPAEREGVDAPVAAERPEVLIWDAPVRVVHWLLALGFLGAFLTAESERWRLLHASLGYTVGGLVAFRLLWGLLGTRHARFASFVRGPGTVLRYLKSLWSGRPEHYAGHNPAGALAIVALLGLAALVTATGYALYNDIGGHSMEELHEVLAEAMLVVVGLHVAGVAIASLLHRENLVRAMVTGRKRAPATEAIRRPWRPLALLVVASVAAWGGWQALTPPAPGPTPHAAANHGRSDARHVPTAEDDDR